MNIKNPPAYDISHYVDAPDFTKIVPRPFWMATKATEGNFLTDDKFIPFFMGMKQINCHRCAYHFHRKANSAESQASRFISVVSPVLEPADTIALDVEEGGETAKQLRDWIDIVRARFPDNLIILYSRKNLLDPLPMFLSRFLPASLFRPWSALDVLPMSQSDREYFKQIPVWTAGYPSNPDLYDAVPSGYVPDPTKFGPVYAWQYFDKAQIPGIQGDTDLNLLSPLYVARLGATEQPPTGEPMYTGKVKSTVGANALNVRVGPNATTTSTGKLSGGDSVSGTKVVVDSDVNVSRLWVYITSPLIGYVAGEYLDPVPTLGVNPFPDETKLDAILSKVTQMAGSVAEVAIREGQIMALLNAILEKVNQNQTDPGAPPSNDGYTGKLLPDLYRVSETATFLPRRGVLPTDWEQKFMQANPSMLPGAVAGTTDWIAVLDSWGNSETVLMDKMYDWLTVNDPGFDVFQDKGFVFKVGDLWHMAMHVYRGEVLKIAEIASGRARIVGFDSEGDSERGAKNLDVISKDATPWYFHRVEGVYRWYPIITPRSPRKEVLQAAWIPIELLEKVG